MTDIGQMGSYYGNLILNFMIMIIGTIFAGAVIFLIYRLVINQRKYNEFKCIIWQNDAFGQLIETTDSAGIFVDPKTKNKRLFLKKANVGLDPDSVPYIQSGKKKVIYLRRDGLKNFRYIRPVITSSDINLSVGEEDVNWAANSYERLKQRFAQNTLLQYLPFIALGFVSVIILVMIIYIVKNFSVLGDVANNLVIVSDNLVKARSGTQIIQ